MFNKQMMLGGRSQNNSLSFLTSSLQNQSQYWWTYSVILLPQSYNIVHKASTVFKYVKYKNRK